MLAKAAMNYKHGGVDPVAPGIVIEKKGYHTKHTVTRMDLRRANRPRIKKMIAKKTDKYPHGWTVVYNRVGRQRQSYLPRHSREVTRPQDHETLGPQSNQEE